MEKLLTEEISHIKKYIDNGSSYLLFKKSKGKRIINVKTLDDNLFFENGDYKTIPNSRDGYVLLYSKDIADKRLKDKDFIKSRIMEMYHVHNQRELISDIFYKYDIINDKNEIIEELTNFYCKYDICENFYNHLVSHYKGKRSDFSIDEEPFNDITQSIAKSLNIDINKKSLTSSTNRENFSNMIYDYLLNKCNELDMDDIKLDTIKTFQDSFDKKVIDNRLITPNIIYSIIYNNILQYTPTQNHEKKAKIRYSQIVSHIQTDFVFVDKETILEKTKRTKQKNLPKEKPLNKKINEDFNIEIKSHSKDILTINILGFKLIFNNHQTLNEFNMNITYENEFLIFETDNEKETYMIEDKNIRRYVPRNRTKDNPYILDLDSIEFTSNEVKKNIKEDVEQLNTQYGEEPQLF